MPAPDVNSLFSRAERAFLAGHLNDAIEDLTELRRQVGDDPAVLHLLALVEKKRGAVEPSRKAFIRALQLDPANPAINTSYAGLLQSIGKIESALAHVEIALRGDPTFADARLSRAQLLQRLGRGEEALMELEKLAAASAAGAVVHSARASVLRQLGRLDEAGAAYDLALRLEPKRPVALHGRARIALERGEPNASELYRQALQVSPGDLTVRLGFAEAREAEGDPRCVGDLEAAVSANPLWIDGHWALARMRWEAGEGTAFTSDLERALEAHPNNRELWVTYASVLASAELPGAAMDAATAAQAAVGDDPALRLIEATHASTGGESERADRLFASLPAGLPGAAIHEAQHRIRRKDYRTALKLADSVRSEDPWNVISWALTGLLWRVFGDSRADWLHGQPGLVASSQLELTQTQIAAIAECLRSLHRTRAHPIGQSLRGGTQTRGRLFDRAEPEVVMLRDAIRGAVRSFWEALPPIDAAHPLLRWRAHTPSFHGSWSVHLSEGGFHVSHIHPNGILSSACYLVVPEAAEAQSGWLEIGRPPTGLDLPLAPLAQIEPLPGRLALFPSTLYHGTLPFSAGERLTSAFDVVAG